MMLMTERQRVAEDDVCGSEAGLNQEYLKEDQV